MPGEAVVTIRGRRWLVDLATTYQELAGGLGGLPSIPAGTGMLFDLGAEQRITVTTVPMLFPLDIVFIGSSLVVTEVAHDVDTGRLVTSERLARFFLEVNAGEAAGVRAGDLATVEVRHAASQQNPTAAVIPQFVNLMAVMMAFSLLLGVVRGMAKSLLPKPRKRPLLYGPVGQQLLPRTTKRPARDDVRVEVWEERDRLHIGIQNKDTGEYVASWWDDEARKMFEQGFFKRGRALQESVLAYAEEVGLLAPKEARRHCPAQTPKSAGEGMNRGRQQEEEKALLVPQRFPKRDRALARLQGYDVIQVHDDGDLTVRSRGKLYMVTTEGQLFEQEHLPGTRKMKPPRRVGRDEESTPRPVSLREQHEPHEKLEFLADSPDHCCQSVNGTGLRPHLDRVFTSAIERTRSR